VQRRIQGTFGRFSTFNSVNSGVRQIKILRPEIIDLKGLKTLAKLRLTALTSSP
jgi:hypothetical protein